MASVVLNQQSPSQLYANGALLGARGLTSYGPVNAVGNSGQGSIFTGGLTIADAAPAAPATVNASSFTTFVVDVAGGGLTPNQLQKFAYADPRVSAQTIQQYEEGYWSPTATAFVAPALSLDSVFVNRPSTQPRSLNDAAPYIGSLTCAAAPVVTPCAGITAASRVRLMLVGGSAAGFAAAVAGGAAAPAITIQVGATTAASTFTATGGVVGMIYAYEVLLA